MDIYKVISDIMAYEGLSIAQVAKQCGLSDSTVRGIVTRKQKTVALDVAFKLSDGLGVSLERLNGNEEQADGKEKSYYETHATDKEFENIVKKYRALDQHGKETVSYILERETERVKQIEQAASTPAATRMINYYYKLASAGTGQIVFDMPPTKRIEIPAIPEYRKADYAIGVNGNSMEPVYHDGDTLLVEMTDHVEIGEIGIFLVNGESFVKKRGETELISLNLGNKNISLNENARCLGRVIGKL